MSSSALGNFLTIADAKFEEGDSRARVVLDRLEPL